MTALQLTNKQQLPNFNLPEKYQSDSWEIKSWEIYTQALKNPQKVWRARSSISDHKFDFTLCKNLHIREELKYFMFHLIEYKKVSVGTFAEYYDRYKLLSEYINTYMLGSSSLLELVDFPHFEKFLSEKKKNKVTIKNGVEIRSKLFKPAKRKSRFITFIEYAQETLQEYYEADIPETDKLVWKFKNLEQTKLKNCVDEYPGKHLDFRVITNKAILKPIQDFCKYELEYITFTSVCHYLVSLKTFYEWLEEETDIENLKDLNRDIIEYFFLWLRCESEFSSHKINITILNLKSFLEWGLILQRKDMPDKPLILNDDYNFKRKIESKYLSDEDMKKVMGLIPLLPKVYGRMIYALILLGIRCSELSFLSVDALKQADDGTYYLLINQYKTKKEYMKPIPEKLALLLKKEIKRNQDTFGKENVKYVFVNEKNKPIKLAILNTNLRKVIFENDIRDSSGELLHVTTHMFRATVGTNLISAGLDPESAAKLLGQTTLSSLSHYATVTNETVKEQLKPRIEKDEMLIRNIGKIEKLKEATMPSRALCNGFCNKNPLTEPCEHANACLNCSMFVPSIQFLNGYYIQLQEVEATIKVAEANDYRLMLKKALKDKENLEKIINALERKREETKDD